MYLSFIILVVIEWKIRKTVQVLGFRNFSTLGSTTTTSSLTLDKPVSSPGLMISVIP